MASSKVMASSSSNHTANNPTNPTNPRRSVDDVWKGIMIGDNSRKQQQQQQQVCKVEVPDDMMTLEDFLVRAGAVDEDDVAAAEEEDVKVRVPLTGSMSADVAGRRRMMSDSGRLFSFDSIPLSPFPSGEMSLFGSGGMLIDGGGGGGHGGVVGRVKRRGSGGGFEQLDKAAQKRQRRMIKNRESAARSRERKQEHQVKLELLASKLEEENEQLLKEKADQTKERLKLLMEKIVPIVEQRRPPRPLRRVRSWQW